MQFHKSSYYFMMPIFALLTLACPAEQAGASTQPYISGHQINFGTGNKYLSATDVRYSGPGPQLSFTRTYNSQSDSTSTIGYGWSGSSTETLSLDTDEIILIQSGGRYVHFVNDGEGNYINEAGAQRVITAVDSGYQLKERSGTIKLFDAEGHLLSTTDTNGNSISYSYSGDELASMSDTYGHSISFTYENDKLTSVISDFGTVSYSYDENDNLITVTRGDNPAISYEYADANDVHNLTGIFNEENTRTLTVEYDDSDRVTRSAKAGDANEVTISYPSTYLREITNSLGVTTTYTLDVLHGIVQVGSFTGPGCSSCGSSSDTSYLYDDRLRVLESTDGKGSITSYTYDDNGNKLTKTVATGTALERTTTYTYTTDNKVETKTVDSIANPGQSTVTSYSYDTAGNMLTRTESGYAGTTTISATTSYSYNEEGQISSIDGPRTDVSDVTTLTYYANEEAQGNNRGRLHTVTNSLGHTITYGSYNIYGQAEEIEGASGLSTMRSFDANGRLTSSTTGTLTTTYSYNNAGELLSLTRPGDRTITYSYDEARRISAITDKAGNSIVYSYDSEGRRTGTEIRDPDGALQQYTNFEYDDSGRLVKVLLPGDAEQNSSYDEVGNLVQTINATGLETTMDYDELNRLSSVVAGEKSTSYLYDDAGNLTSVMDALSNSTSFSYDDFGNRLTRSAPDTGLTSYSYDPAGNLETVTDALARFVDFEYDALNRPTREGYDGGEILFNYDEGTNGTGRITSITDDRGSRSFTYSAMGQLTAETRTIDGTTYSTAYSYSDVTAELQTITYPSGLTLSYSRDESGNISAINVDGTSAISGVTHLPFGPLATATLGSVSLVREYDQRYNLTAIQAGSFNYSYERDAEGHVTAIANLPAPTITDGSESYTYNEENNQLTAKDATGYSYDAVGNMLTAGNQTYHYDGLNRITSIDIDTTEVAQYGYDAANRRITKTVDGTTIHYHYDSNSLLIGETLADGTPLRDYIYLEGEPVALREYENNPGLYYYLNDHLGTPQQLVQADGTVVWAAAYLPFGGAQILTETVANNLRFPGQYFDGETGLHYNWHRFYDPETGRYISADPIGLAGGINLYLYARGNPIGLIDPRGLCPPNWEPNDEGTGCWPTDYTPACPYGQTPDASGECGYTWNKDPKTPQGESEYCKKYSKYIGECADIAGLYAFAVTVDSAGTTSAVTVSVGVVAKLVGFANGYATFKLCPSSFSSYTSMASPFLPNWYGAAVSMLDSILTAAGL